MKSSFFKTLFFLFVTISVVSCVDDEPTEPTFPTTYNFENVNYSGQTQRLAMLAEMKTYMTTANTIGTTISADRLKAMFANDTANAGWAGTYDVSKQLKNKTLENQQALFEALFDDFETASQSTVAGSNGQAGVVTSTDGTKSYLLNGNGLEFAQVIEKGLMGACFYYQATSIYLGDDKMNVDNETVTAGEGTAMEHHWDEAFGYLGVPIDFPISTDGLVFWGKYSNSRNAVLATNEAIMSNFLKGRAAISNKDLTTRDAAIVEIRKYWELVSVGSALHYLNEALANLNDDAIRNHSLSEAAAFVYALQFNTMKKVTNTNVSEILTLIGGSDNFATMNFYNATQSNLENAKNRLADYYNLQDKKDNL